MGNYLNFFLLSQIVAIYFIEKYSLILGDLGELRFVRNNCKMSSYQTEMLESRSRLTDAMQLNQLFAERTV